MYDVIIIGGGIIGSSSAYYLTKADPSLKVVVVEMDDTYAKASTTLSMTNARIQFSLSENIEISKYAFEILEKFEEDMAVEDKLNIAYRREGNLFIANEETQNDAKKSFELQKSLNCAIEWWDPKKIKEAYPLYEGISEYVGGAFGPKDGHFDAYAILMGYKAKAKSFGAKYVEDEVVELLKSEGRIEGVKTAKGETLNAKFVINCAGAWAAKVAKTAGIALPIDPIKRQVFALDPAIKPKGPLPLTVLPSGLYFRTETGGMILIGKSMDEDEIGFNFNYDDQRFTENLWFELAEFVPKFESLKLVRGWAGLYAVNTLDGNAILGEWPDLKGFYLANGFSGHGLQQAPAVGRYISELILQKSHSMDLSIFTPQRILDKKPVSEGGLV